MAAICLGLMLLVAGASVNAQAPTPSPAPKQPPRIVVVREPRPMVLEALIKRELPVKPKRPLVSDRAS